MNKKYFIYNRKRHDVPGFGEVSLSQLNEKDLLQIYEAGRSIVQLTAAGAKHFYAKKNSEDVCRVIGKRPFTEDVKILLKAKPTKMVTACANERIFELSR